MDELLAAIDVHPETFRRLETAASANDVGNLLKRQLQQHGALHERLRLADNVMRGKLEQAYRQIFNRKPNDAMRTALLDAALTEIVQRLPVLSLAPEAGLFKEVIDHLHGAAATVDGLTLADEKLLDLLRRLREDLTTMNWGDASARSGVRAMVESHASALGSSPQRARGRQAIPRNKMIHAAFGALRLRRHTCPGPFYSKKSDHRHGSGISL